MVVVVAVVVVCYNTDKHQSVSGICICCLFNGAIVCGLKTFLTDTKDAVLSLLNITWYAVASFNSATVSKFCSVFACEGED